MLKEINKENKILIKITCKCGRKMLVQRKGFNKSEFKCSTCMTVGLDESRKLFLEINRKSENTKIF